RTRIARSRGGISGAGREFMMDRLYSLRHPPGSHLTNTLITARPILSGLCALPVLALSGCHPTEGREQAMNEERQRAGAPYPIRPITEAEWPDFVALDDEAFNVADPPEVTAERWTELIEFERTLCAFDGDVLVGSTAAYSLTMTVPGGPIPVAGITGVAVLPSHRRKGILRSLMTRQLADLHEGGEPVAALYASEAAIYGRFGYGRAADAMFFRIPRHGSAFVPHAPADPKLRLRVA